MKITNVVVILGNNIQTNISIEEEGEVLFW